MGTGPRLYVKITRDTLPRVKDKYPFLYLEHGRLAIDDSSVKWIDSDGNVVRIPIATICSLFLGPGTTVTHEAIKVLSAANCSVCWMGEDSLLFYAFGDSPTSDTKNFRFQMKAAANPTTRLSVAKRMFQDRFPGEDLTNRNLSDLRGMEGRRVKALYLEKATYYRVGWSGRSFVPNHFQLSSTTNKILTACNAALYGVTASVIHALGYSPHIGFVHTGSPLPFVYDISDLYKAEVSIDLAFALTRQLNGIYEREKVSDAFRQRVIDLDLLKRMTLDIPRILGKNE